MVSSASNNFTKSAGIESIGAQARGHQRHADALLGGTHHGRHGVETHQPIGLDRLDAESRGPLLPGLAALLMQQQRLAVEIRIGIDAVLQQESRRAGGNETLREQFVHGQPVPGTRADDDGQIRLGRMRLRRGKGGFDADVGLFTRLAENDASRGSNNSFAKKEGTFKRMMVRP